MQSLPDEHVPSLFNDIYALAKSSTPLCQTVLSATSDDSKMNLYRLPRMREDDFQNHVRGIIENSKNGLDVRFYDSYKGIEQRYRNIYSDC